MIIIRAFDDIDTQETVVMDNAATLNRDALVLFNNTLNEALEISDEGELIARTGFTRLDLITAHASISDVLRRMRFTS